MNKNPDNSQELLSNISHLNNSFYFKRLIPNKMTNYNQMCQVFTIVPSLNRIEVIFWKSIRRATAVWTVFTFCQVGDAKATSAERETLLRRDVRRLKH